MAKNGKPFVQGIQYDSVPHEEGKAAIEFFKELGCKYSVSFLHREESYGKDVIKDNADVLFLHYKNGGTTTNRIVEYLEEAERKGKEVYLLYKRKMDGSFGLYSFGLDHYGNVEFKNNITQFVLEKIRETKLIIEDSKKGIEMKKEYCSEIHERAYPVFDEPALQAQLSHVKHSHAGMLLRRRRKKLK
jgi:hypothetical protein